MVLRDEEVTSASVGVATLVTVAAECWWRAVMQGVMQ